MIRSVVLAVGLAGCMAQDDQTSSVALGIAGGFECQNRTSISGVQCFGNTSIFSFILSVRNSPVLDGNKINVLANDLSLVKTADDHTSDYSKIANDLICVTASDFMDKFHYVVAPPDMCVASSPPVCGCVR